MTRWLSVIGIGEDGVSGLSPAALLLLAQAEVLFGGARHLALLPPDARPRQAWKPPLADTIADILACRGRPVAVLATGDPLCYGIGTTLVRLLPMAEMIILPAPSSFSMACARLGWSLPDVETLTLHGRPPELVQPFLQPGARLLILSADGVTPAIVAALLRDRGYGRSRLTVLEHMGGRDEHRHDGTAADWPRDRRTADFNLLAVECQADPGVRPLSRVPGIPDEAFRHDGQLTKREVRAATLAALVPLPGQLLWDVGAGCGSIALEWLRTDRRCRAIAIERAPERLALLALNAAALGCPQLAVVAGAAPAALADLEPPDAVFIGGGLGTTGLLELCWDALRPGGRLVANAVTLEGERRLLDWYAAVGGTLTRLQIVRAEPVGPRFGWRPLMPVTQYAGFKP